MDWTNTSHVLQAVWWSLQLVIFMHGYSVGARTTV